MGVQFSILKKYQLQLCSMKLNCIVALALFKASLGFNSTFITCEDYASVINKSFCIGIENGNYPVNDDNCALFYNCWEGATFCQSCDELSEGATPIYVHSEVEDFGICERPGAGVCPTPGYPTNFIYTTTVSSTSTTFIETTTTVETTDAPNEIPNAQNYRLRE